RVWLLDELPASVASKLLRGLEAGERDQTAVLLGYPEDSIGRRMSPRFVTLRPWHTVAEAMERVHGRREEVGIIYGLPVTDAGRRVVGAVRLRELSSGEHSQRVEDLMVRTGTAEVCGDAEKVARRSARRGACALSVVDH